MEDEKQIETAAQAGSSRRASAVPEIPPGGLLHHPEPSDDDASPPRGNRFPVVGIGASAGGLEAFTQLLRALPPDTGMAFVLVQHLDPSHDTLLPDLLAQTTSMPVVVVEDGMKVEPNHVYSIPQNTSMVITDGTLRLLERAPGLHLPIDIFFRSLAQVQGSKAIGVVLSGNASDGSAGIRAIKAECGITFAEDENTAKFSGMPRAAIATGSVDFVLPPAEIGRELARIARNPYLVPPSPEIREILPEGDGDLAKIFTMLDASTRVDFSHYKLTTVRRRISRRMMVHRLQAVHEYAEFMQEHPEEIRELYRDLLISVTRFFREPEAFAALAHVLRASLPSRPRDERFRVWVPGCATGEEVYSLAILLQEIMEELQLNIPIQLFGTDISESALDRARSGVYTEIITHDLTPERLRRRFSRTDGGLQINKGIRELCIFARQDLTRDPPFSHLDLISCRNVLIYLDSTLQRRVLPVFHYSLKPGAVLFLGTAETTSTTSELFAAIDREHRIFARRDVPARFSPSLHPPRAPVSSGEVGNQPALSPLDLTRRIDRLIQNNYTPDAVVVDSSFHIVQFRGHTSFYLDPSPGEATLNLLNMVREAISLPLRRALHEARARHAAVVEHNGIVEFRGERRRVTIEVTPLPGPSFGEQYFLVVFRDTSGPAAPGPGAEGEAPASATEMARLERELAEAHNYLRALAEDHEASSEELRAANEEVRSANEELQSTNEELSTTKEELQSANEELTTLNEELHIRNNELAGAAGDLSNLLSAVNIPIVMVDQDLRLRRFTTAAEKLLDLVSIDLGRPLRHFSALPGLNDIEAVTRSVIETLETHQQEVRDRQGAWYMLTVRPYRTTDNHINGAVITFQDIDPLKRSLEVAEETRDYAESIIETLREPLVILDGDLRVQRATAAFYETFHVSREETEGRFFYDLGSGQWNRPRLRELLGNALFRGEAFNDYEVSQSFPHIGTRTMRLNARPLPRAADGPKQVLVAIEDLTQPLQHAEMRYRRLFETAKDGMVIVDAETGNVIDVNPFFSELTACPREELVGRRLDEIRAFQNPSLLTHLLATAREGEVVRYNEVVVQTRHQTKHIVEIIANRYNLGGQLIIQVNVRDVTQRRQSETALRESEERFRLLLESVRDFALFQMDLQGRVVTWNLGAERLLGYCADEILGQDAAIIFTPEDIEKGEHLREIQQARTEGRAEDERWHVRKDGSRFFASGVLTQMRDAAGRQLGYVKIMRDVTARRGMESDLRRSIREKEVLLREVHHRVKNNLQVITSLLNLQSERIADPAMLSMLEETRARIQSLGAIHEFAYGSDDFSKIEFRDYLDRVVDNLFALRREAADHVEVSIDGERASLELHHAVPAGLIVNELLTNALKHAFPDGRRGKVQVRFACDGDQCTIEVADDGVGVSENVDPATATSMGLQLVQLLTEQLQGKISVERTNGTRFCLEFSRTPPAA